MVEGGKSADLVIGVAYHYVWFGGEFLKGVAKEEDIKEIMAI